MSRAQYEFELLEGPEPIPKGWKPRKPGETRVRTRAGCPTAGHNPQRDLQPGEVSKKYLDRHCKTMPYSIAVDGAHITRAGRLEIITYCGRDGRLNTFTQIPDGPET